MNPDVPRDEFGEPIRRPFPIPVRPRWRMLKVGEDDVHVLPNTDVMVHDVGDEDRESVCNCGPTSRLAPGHDSCDHPDIWVHQHHALDGRPLPNLT